MECKHRKYNISVKITTVSTEIEILKNCNGWVAINKSDVAVSVSDVPLNPSPSATTSGESYGVSGNSDEIYIGRITVNIPAGATRPKVVVIQKYFTD